MSPKNGRAAQEVGLRVPANEHRELDLRHVRKQAIEPQLRAFAPRRQIAARPAAGIAQAHRHDRNASLVVEVLGVDAHPVAQSFAAAVIPRDTARVHPRTRRLANDEDARPRARLQHGARAEGKVSLA